jgi:hypothetical protein
LVQYFLLARVRFGNRPFKIDKPYGTHIHHSLVMSKGVFTIIVLLNTKKHMYKYKVCKSKDYTMKKALIHFFIFCYDDLYLL